MTQEIMVLNPSKIRTRTKGKKTMPKRRKRSRVSYARTVVPVPRRTRRRARRNPSATGGRVRRYARRAANTARGLFTSLSPMATAKLAAQNLIGMLITQFASKKFGGANSPGGSKDNWGKKNYLFALLGAVGGAALADLIKRGTGKNVLQGGLALIAYQVFVNEIAPQNTFLANNFGEEDNPLAYGYGYGQEMAPEYLGGYSEGDVVQGSDGVDYALGIDGYWRPTDESHRILTGADEELLGETLTQPGRLGEVLSTPGRLGEDPYSAIYGAEGVN